jgi:hypothetical protein
LCIALLPFASVSQGSRVSEEDSYGDNFPTCSWKHV